MKHWSEIRRYAFNKLVDARINRDDAMALSWAIATEICEAMKEAESPTANIGRRSVPNDQPVAH